MVFDFFNRRYEFDGQEYVSYEDVYSDDDGKTFFTLGHRIGDEPDHNGLFMIYKLSFLKDCFGCDSVPCGIAELGMADIRNPDTIYYSEPCYEL